MSEDKEKELRTKLDHVIQMDNLQRYDEAVDEIDAIIKEAKEEKLKDFLKELKEKQKILKEKQEKFASKKIRREIKQQMNMAHYYARQRQFDKSYDMFKEIEEIAEENGLDDLVKKCEESIQKYASAEENRGQFQIKADLYDRLKYAKKVGSAGNLNEAIKVLKEIIKDSDENKFSMLVNRAKRMRVTFERKQL